MSNRRRQAVAEIHHRLTIAQQRVLDWMTDGDRCLHRTTSDPRRYGYFINRKFHYLCSRQTVDALVRSGEVEWLNDCPADQRAMIPLKKLNQKKVPE